MAVDSLYTVRMADYDNIAVAALPTAEHHPAAFQGKNRCALRDRQVYAGVVPRLARKRVFAYTVI